MPYWQKLWLGLRRLLHSCFVCEMKFVLIQHNTMRIQKNVRIMKTLSTFMFCYYISLICKKIFKVNCTAYRVKEYIVKYIGGTSTPILVLLRYPTRKKQTVETQNFIWK